MSLEQERTDYKNRLGAGAFAVGMISVPAAFLPFGIALAALALILGFLARKSGRESNRPVRLANTAIVLAIVSAVIWVLVITGFALFAGVYDG